MAGKFKKLIEDISKNAAILQDYLNSNNLPEPSFEEDGLKDFNTLIPQEEEKIHAARAALISAAKDVHDLAMGPNDRLQWDSDIELHCLMALRILCHYNIPQTVPFHSSISFENLAKVTGLNKDMIIRCIRMAATRRYFKETLPGHVTHTASSRLLAEDETMRAIVYLRAQENAPSVWKATEALEKYGYSGKPEHTSFSLAFGNSSFEDKEKHPERMAMFAQYMNAVTAGDEAESIPTAYDWSKFGDGTVVDVGGGMGHISAAVARYHPQLKFVVQDNAGLRPSFDSLINSLNLNDRISFEPHDFFSPQPRRGPSAFLLRNIFHDWADSYCQVILKHLVAAMTPTTRIVIVDIVVPPPGDGPHAMASRIHTLDMVMWANFNAKERSLEQWEELFRSVDERLKIVDVVYPPKVKRDNIIEVMLVESDIKSKVRAKL